LHWLGDFASGEMAGMTRNKKQRDSDTLTREATL